MQCEIFDQSRWSRTSGRERKRISAKIARFVFEHIQRMRRNPNENFGNEEMLLTMSNVDGIPKMIEKGHGFVIAWRKGILLGLMHFHESKISYLVESIIVSPEERGRGIGKKLFESLYGQSSGKGKPYVNTLFVTPPGKQLAKKVSRLRGHLVRRKEGYALSHDLVDGHGKIYLYTTVHPVLSQKKQVSRRFRKRHS